MPELREDSQAALEAVKKAGIGAIVPIFKVIRTPILPLDFFAKLSGYGRKKYAFLLESADTIQSYGERTIGSASPCLRISGKKEDFEIQALTATGRTFLKALKGDLKFCDQVRYGKDSITGKLLPQQRNVSEPQRLKLKNPMDLLRAVAFKFKPAEESFMPSAGIFGAFSYDLIDRFENLPSNKEDPLQDPDYEFYYADNLFLADHAQGITYLVANALITGTKRDEIYRNAVKTIKLYEKTLQSKLPKPKKFRPKKQTLGGDISSKEFEDTVNELKKRILEGDIFQASLCRFITTDFNAEPLDIYKALRSLSPSPYMFFLSQKNGILLGSSPETCLRVQGLQEKAVEIRLVSAVKQRGMAANRVDPDIDARYEAELKTDGRIIGEHTMLLDAARNDIARLSRPGTSAISRSFSVEKYAAYQSLVSVLRGTLRGDMDALHALAALMNAGTVTGIPKRAAMRWLRKSEKTRRGFYGGAVGYLTPHGNMDSAVIVHSIHLKGNKAYVPVAARIMAEAVPKTEYEASEHQAKMRLAAVRKAGGLK